MNKIFLAFSLMLLSLLFIGCTKIDGNIEYNSGVDLTGSDYAKLSYLLEGVIDVKKDEANIWNKPLSSDEQKGTFIFNILNNNYMDKYENEVEAPEDPYYPVLDNSFIDNDGDVHDSVFPIDRDVKLVYKKSDIDNFMNETFGDTLKDGNRIKQSGMILSGNDYLFFTYLYYGSDLIGNKGRTTLFEIDNINSASDKDIEVSAKYYDDILSGDDLEDSECKLTYHISKNYKSFFGFMVNEYKYEGCEINPDYLAPDLPSQIIYGFDNGIFNDYIGLKKEFRSEEINVDLNNDGIDEFFRIGVDSPNGSQVLGLVGDKGYNFIYDFSGDVVDDYNELKDGLFIDMYFEDLDGDDIKEVIVAIGDKETGSEVNIYQLGLNNGFVLLGKIYGRSYLEYDIDSMFIHAPYSNNGLCQIYQLKNGKVTKLII